MVDDDPIGLNRYARSHRHKATGVKLKRLVAYEKGDILRRAHVAVRPHSEPTNQPVTNTGYSASGTLSVWVEPAACNSQSGRQAKVCCG